MARLSWRFWACVVGIEVLHVAALCWFIVAMHGLVTVLTREGTRADLVTDKEIRANFENQRATFEELKAMILAETSVNEVGLDHVGGYWLRRGRWENSRTGEALRETAMLEAVDLDGERFRRYTSLLKAIGANWIGKAPRARAPDGVPVRIWWPSVSVGFGPAGWSKRVLFDSNPQEGTVPDTDEAYARERKSLYLSSLGDSWYIESSTR